MKKIIVIVILVLVVAAVAILAWQVINLRQEIASVKIENVVDGNGQVLANLSQMDRATVSFFNRDIQKYVNYYLKTGEPSISEIMNIYYLTEDCSGALYGKLLNPYAIVKFRDQYYTPVDISSIDLPIHVRSFINPLSNNPECTPADYDSTATKLQEITVPSYTPPLSIVVE